MEQMSLNGYPHAKIYKMKQSEIEKVDFAVCAQPRETIDSYYKRQIKKPTLICNGGFFNMSDGTPILNLVDEGRVASSSSKAVDGFGIIGNSELIYGQCGDKRFRDFVSGYPVLIHQGKEVTTTLGSEVNYNARRTLLGYNKDFVYLITVESPGYNLKKSKEIMLKLGITEGINLDGGGSTRLLYNGKLQTSGSIGNRAVDNVVCFYLKEEAPQKTIYRVQYGAFAIKSNAEAYRDTIAAIPDTIGAEYKNSYIRFIDGLYKVQVGAYSIRENAERVVADLKKHGYTAFITTK